MNVRNPAIVTCIGQLVGITSVLSMTYLTRLSRLFLSTGEVDF